MTKTSLHHLLTRVLYVGKVPHKHEVHDGQQPALVGEAVWQRVQDTLRRRGSGSGPRQGSGALLGGLVFCVPCARALTPAYACKKGRQRYRYYTCTHAQKNGRQTCPTPSVPAAALEHFVVGQIQTLAGDPDRLRAMARAGGEADADSNAEEANEAIPLNAIAPAAWQHLPAARQAELLRRLVQRIDYDGGAGKVRITFQPRGILALVPTEKQP